MTSPSPSSLIVGGRCVLESGLQSATMHLSKGLITRVEVLDPGDATIPLDSAALDSTALDSTALVDATGLTVAPGFVDLQINGGFGIDLMTDPDGIWELGQQLPATGVTSFLPTLVSSPPAVIEKFLEVLGSRPAGYLGAEPLGAHLEGPFLNPARAGAHARERLRELAELTSAQIVGLARFWSRDERVALVTVAPELPGALDLIDELTDSGVTVSLGHSQATASQGQAAIDAGATMVTHLFNAMASVGHRNPNLAGLALADERLTPTMIVDGLHVDPLIVKATWNARPSRGLALVTDAVAAMGQGAGEHSFGALGVISDGASVRTSTGVLAGSLITMDQAVSNLMAFTGCSLDDALHAASSVPASLVGRHDRGSLTPGAAADVVLLENGPEGITVKATYIAGKLMPRAGA